MINQMNKILSHYRAEKKPTDYAEADAKNNMNPYFQSRLLWDDLYGSVQKRCENSYRLLAVMMLVNVMAIGGLIATAMQPKTKPYVALIRGHELITAKEYNRNAFKKSQPILATLFTKAFIQASRNVSLDSEVNQANRVKAFSFVSGSATQVLKEQLFFDAKKGNAHHLHHAVITTLLLKTPHAIDVRWREIIRDSRSGEIISQESYAADITYAFKKPSNDPVILSHNPLGFTITSLSFAKDNPSPIRRTN